MSKKTRISLTFSHSNQEDVEIFQFLQRFGSGKGVQARSYEVKKLLMRALQIEAMHLPTLSIEKAAQQTTRLLASPAPDSSAPGGLNIDDSGESSGLNMSREFFVAQTKKFKASVVGVPGFESLNKFMGNEAPSEPASKS